MSDKHGNQSDPYRVLGVSSSASKRQIRRAYLALAKRHHPDRGGDAARFDEITKAWKQLSDQDDSTTKTKAPRARPPGRSAARGNPSTARTRSSQRATPEPVRFIPPLAHGPLKVNTKPPVTVDALAAQQVVHGSIPGGFRRRKQRAGHARLSEVLQTRVQSALPAVRIFHGVTLAKRQVVDTVLLGGTKLAVFSVAHAPPDVYQFNGSQLVGRKRIEIPDLSQSVIQLQQLLPNVEVAGFAVVFSANPHAPTIQATDGLNTLGLAEPPASIMDAVRNIKLFIGTGDHNVVDRALMGQLIAKL